MSSLSGSDTAALDHYAAQTSHQGQFIDHEPRIYALASRPKVPGQAESCEWSIELHIPATSSISRPPSPTTPSTKHRHGFLSGMHLNKHNNDKHNNAKRSPELKPRPDQPDMHYYFSFSSPTPTQTPPLDTILRIRLPPILPLPGTATPKSLIDQVLRSVPPPTISDSSQTWLPKAFRILQMRDVLPPADRGFDVSKFIAFAGSYLERTLHGKGMHSQFFSLHNTPANSRPQSRVTSRATSPTRSHPSSYKEPHHHDLIHQLHSHALAQSQQQPIPSSDQEITNTTNNANTDANTPGFESDTRHPEEVDYLTVLRQNMRLKRLLSSANTDYCVVNADDDLADLALDDYGNSVPSTNHKPPPAKKGFAGFWFTKGSGRGSGSNSHSRNTSVERLNRETWRRRDDVYGGLM